MGFGNSCLSCQQTSWDRVYSVVKNLQQWGVDSSRFIFSAAQDGDDPLVVSIRSLHPGENGPVLTAPCIPCYNKHRLPKGGVRAHLKFPLRPIKITRWVIVCCC